MLAQLVQAELRQRTEEGCPVGALTEQLSAAEDDQSALLAIYQRLRTLHPAADWPYREPTNLPDIRDARPVSRPLEQISCDAVDADVADRIRGGWFGRCAGMVLGKPVEMAPFMDQRGALRRYLEAARVYPLSDYIPFDADAADAVGVTELRFPNSQRGNIRYVESDDDIRYTIMGLEILERKGAAFRTADVAHWWTHRLPAAECFTAEEAAYRNLMWIGGHHEPHRLTSDDWIHVRTWLNPYREWIGAQIRADGWALACPGRPALAAEFAWRDGMLSHERNGVYGEMFCAAMLAAAAVQDDPRAIVHAGLEQIPERSRLTEAVRRTMEKCEEVDRAADRFEEIHDWLWDRFGHYHCVHTINNAAAVVAALLLGGHDFGKVITLAVQVGWDTDCNGATAGAICGTMLGSRRLPPPWIEPLGDRLLAELPGFHPIEISACARRHVAVARVITGAES